MKKMSMFVKTTGPDIYPPRIVCFVCGMEGPADYPLFIAPHGLTNDKRPLPHFPLLRELQPPMGCLRPDITVSSCRTCYSNLMKQWEDNEKGGVPLENRVYWTKRVSGLPILMPEQQLIINRTELARARLFPYLIAPSAAPVGACGGAMVPQSVASLAAASVGLPAVVTAAAAVAASSVASRTSAAGPLIFPTPHQQHPASLAAGFGVPGGPNSSTVNAAAILSPQTTGRLAATVSAGSHPGAYVAGSPLNLGSSAQANAAATAAAVVAAAAAAAAGNGRLAAATVNPTTAHASTGGAGGPPGVVWQEMGPPPPSSSAAGVAAQMLPTTLTPGASSNTGAAGTVTATGGGTAPGGPESSQDDNDSALDLSSGNRDREGMKSRSSAVSHISAASHHSSYLSEGAGSSTDILDLTLPDKNATTEVCYVCGDEYKKGTLTHIFTRSTGKLAPHYPSLVFHSRPPRSRPMDYAGRVLSCDECFHFLYSQYEKFEAAKVPHADRNYTLRKRQTAQADSATFVCYICALDYHSSSLRLLYCRPNSESEPFYPHIEQTKPPPGVSPISSGGMVQVCSHCYNCTKEKHKGYTGDTRPSAHSIEPPPKKRKSSRASVEIVMDPDQQTDDTDLINNPADIECLLCRRKYTVHSFKYLNSQGPPLGGLPYFPFLRTLPKLGDEPGYAFEEDSLGRVRACSTCTTSLFNQWTTYQRESLPIDERMYYYHSLAGPQSSGRVTPGTLLSRATATPTSGRSLRSPGGGGGGVSVSQPGPSSGSAAPASINVSAAGAHNSYNTTTSAVAVTTSSSSTVKSVTTTAGGGDLNRSRSSNSLSQHQPTGSASHRHLLAAANQSQPTAATSGEGSSSVPPSIAASNFSTCAMGGAASSNLSGRGCSPLSPAGSVFVPPPTDSHSPRLPVPPTSTSAANSSLPPPPVPPPQCHSPISNNSAQSATEQTGGGGSGSHKPSNSSSSFYCFLCGLHSELSFARMLYSEPQGKKAPFFPFMKDHIPKPRAETIRENGAALVCTFCYHSVIGQWNRYQESRNSPSPSSRTYNFNDYTCFVCSVKTYRKRIRAVSVGDYPFLRQHKASKGTISMENGEMTAVCLDCYESLKHQFNEAAKYGIPLEKRQYNWMQIPPPPEDSGLQLATPKERLEKHMVTQC